MLNDSPAAWVQGVGSIAAILAAIWIERGTVRREERRRKVEARGIAGFIIIEIIQWRHEYT